MTIILFKRILYWFGIGLELLSACLVAEVCQASKVFQMRKEPLSMTLELSRFVKSRLAYNLIAGNTATFYSLLRLAYNFFICGTSL